MPDDDAPFEVTNTRVFDYQEEVVVELHGRVDGEFDVVTYRFTPAQDDDGLRFPGSVDSDHEGVVREKLAENGFSVA